MCRSRSPRPLLRLWTARAVARALASLHQQFGVARVGLIGPIHDEEVLADMAHAHGAVPLESVTAIHFEDVPIPRNGQDTGCAIGLVRRKIDRGEVLDRIVRVVVLDPRTGTNRG